MDKIIDQLQQFVQNFDLFGLKEYWVYLDRRLFCRLEDVYRSTVNKLRTSLYRYYVICAVQVTSCREIRLSVSETKSQLNVSFLFLERKPGEDSGVFPEAGGRAAGSA